MAFEIVTHVNRLYRIYMVIFYKTKIMLSKQLQYT